MSKRIIALLVTALISAPALAQDAAAGERQFLQCRACHTIEEGGHSDVRPNLFGLVGAKAASLPGYAYSAALQKSGIIWTPDVLDAWLKRPSALVPGNKMVFAGVPDATVRANIIAYLATLKAKK